VNDGRRNTGADGATSETRGQEGDEPGPERRGGMANAGSRTAGGGGWDGGGSGGKAGGLETTAETSQRMRRERDRKEGTGEEEN